MPALSGELDWHPEGGYHSYDRSIPIVATTLQELREHGPAGPAFWRFSREDRQPLLDAIGNARRDAYLTRRRQAARGEQRRRKEREAAQREARRPVCADCGQKFTDDRWGAIGYTPDWSTRESHPHLCKDCQDRALAAEAQAEADERERQEQERLRQEAEEQAAAQKAAAGSPASAPDPDQLAAATDRAGKPKAVLGKPALSVAAATLGQMNGDEQLQNGRLYGTDHDDPHPGPLPHRTYAALVGGPLDGLLLDIHGWRTKEVDDGMALSTMNSDGGPAAAPCTTRAQANHARSARV